MRNWIVGVMYCSNPNLLSGTRAAAPANASSGIAVTMPAVVRSSACPAPWLVKLPLPCAAVMARNSSATGVSAAVSMTSPYCSDPDDALDQTVGAEAEREHECDPRRSTRFDSEHGDADRSDGHRRPLRTPQLLPEHQHSERYGDQRVDEVPERRLDHVVVVDAPDVDAPVDADEHGRRGEQGQPSSVTRQAAQ